MIEPIGIKRSFFSFFSIVFLCVALFGAYGSDEECHQSQLNRKILELEDILNRHDLTDALQLLTEIKSLYYLDSMFQSVMSKEWLVEMFRNPNVLNRFIDQMSSLSCVYFDIDHFSHINGTLGHESGDYVLKRLINHVQAVLKTSTKHQDTFLVRTGGDEFLILIRNIPQRRLREVSARLLLSVVHYKSIFSGLKRLDSHQIELDKHYREDHLTLSMGINWIKLPEDLQGRSKALEYLYDALIIEADRFLYMSKNAGRGRFTDWTGQTYDAKSLNQFLPQDR